MTGLDILGARELGKAVLALARTAGAVALSAPASERDELEAATAQLVRLGLALIVGRAGALPSSFCAHERPRGSQGEEACNEPGSWPP